MKKNDLLLVKGEKNMQYARWATKEELKEKLMKIKKGEQISQVGIPLMYEENTMYIDKNRNHTLIIGSTGSGKTQTTILPMLELSIQANESFLTIDPKGELYKSLGKRLNQQEYKTTIIDLEDTSLGNNWNPLLLPYQVYKQKDKDRAQEMIEEVAYYLLSSTPFVNQDPFWENTAIDYFTGLTLYLFETKEEKDINLREIIALSTKLSKKGEADKFLDKMNSYSPIYIALSTTLKAPPETKGSILSVFQQKILPFISKTNLSNLLSKSDTNFENIINEKTAIFIITGSTEISKRLVPLYISQIMNSKNLYDTDRKPFNMLLDEFGYMLKMKNYAITIEQARGLNIQITAAIQNFTQLTNTYGPEDIEILKLCFSNILYLYSNDISTLEEISKMCGEISKGIPLITVEELKTMNPFEAIILLPRMYPAKTKLVPFYKFGVEKNEICEISPRV